jgi:cysteinyl-tRNA synthetase
MRLFNTLTRKKEAFEPLQKGKVGMYTCGPTVYWYAHIGNLRTYVFEDILKRVLLWNGYEVKHVMNITDVGHLTSDQDAGEDKLERGAKREGKSVWEIARFYEEAFKRDIKRLNIIEPNIWCRATDHIEDQIALVKRLEEKGFTYDTGEVIYFDTSKLPDYGKLARINVDELKAGARVEPDPKKKNPLDFALWFKTVGKHANHIMRWPSPWGEGFPGWHIECSAMSMKYLGETFDIHCGGIDHIPIHHTNEIAQSEAATGKPFVRYWLHGEFLRMAEAKMAKSEGNVILLQTLIDNGYDPLDFRYLCLTTHYRDPLNFAESALASAKKAREGLLDFMRRLRNISKETSNPDIDEIIETTRKRFENMINDDLNVPQALAIVHDFVRQINILMAEDAIGKRDAEKVLVAMKDFDKIFGVLEEKEKQLPIPKEELERLIAEREAARKKGDFKRSDAIRAQLKEKGIILEDTKEGATWRIV